MPTSCEHLDGPVPQASRVELLVERDRLGDLVADGEDRVERGHRLLEDHRDRVAADVSDIVLVDQRQQVAVVEQDLARDDLARAARSGA